MSLFICSHCGCVDNTALAVGTDDTLGYWGREKFPLCAFCLTKKWHNKFPREPWNGIDEVINPFTQQAREKLKERVELLRQWLNEDRITDPEKMVSNEQILKWLL